MTPATTIQNYLLLHLNREAPGLDVWRANVVGRKPGVSVVAAGEPGQADLTGVWGGKCRWCDAAKDHPMHTVAGCDEFSPLGRSIWIEVKSPNDTQSANQKDFERRVTRLGACYIICKIRRKETVTTLSAYFRLSAKNRENIPHPTEIAEFFTLLRGAL